MTRIGFVGIGLMGHAMGTNLLGRGYPLTVIGHRNQAPVDDLVAKGANKAASHAELAAASDIVCICVTTSKVVEQVVLGPNGVLEGLKEGTVVIDFGTSVPASTLALGEAVAAKGGHYLDAPLGRTPSHALEGKLNIMVGGDAAVFERVKPLLDDLGENVFHVGPLSAGHKIKLINNFFAMTTACAMSEAAAMARKAGVDLGQLYKVMSAGPLHSGMMDFVMANVLEGDPTKLSFTIANALKDVGYYVALADDQGVPSFIAPATKQLLALAKAEGWGGRMVPEMYDFAASIGKE